MSRVTLFLCALCLLVADGVATAQVTIPMNPHYAFHYIDPGDAAMPDVPIDLAANGLAPGYTIKIEPLGDFDNGPNGDTFSAFMVVFGGSATLLGPTLLHRVPDAIDCGTDYVTHTSCPSGYLTDIPEDFTVDPGGATVQIPMGATHLFVVARDCFYSDNSDPDGDYAVRITVLATTGVSELPPILALHATCPNPFNPRTTIRFDLPAAGPVRLSVYDLAGRLVRVLVEGEMPEGSHQAVWDGRDATGRSAPSGSYLARLVAGGRVEGVRLSLVR